MSNSNSERRALIRFGMPLPMHTSLSCTSFLITRFSLFSETDTVVSGFGFRDADDILHLPFMHMRCRTHSRCPQSRLNYKCIISSRMCPSRRQHCTTRQFIRKKAVRVLIKVWSLLSFSCQQRRLR